MIIYIHGFSSSGFGKKALEFKEYFQDKLIHISLPTIPFLAINNLEQIIETFLSLNEKVYLIGSSLGGYYALYLANKYNLKAVLINPAIKPLNTLSHYEGVKYIKNYYDNSEFEFTKEHIESLKNYEVPNIQNPKNIMTLLQKGDEVLDYKISKNILKNTNIIIEDAGNHSFININRYFHIIEDFYT
ncbi:MULTISPECIES: YqiA/YcfP family alpha/beta fold hydrolase [Arcobacteraceae]|uniref:YqiA/YcfP family alpha/beta fold hydrolase n=1 Tax=Arcobacteraceae TaxID=2808963 RepID=UPI000DEB96D0|nr:MULTISPECIES: YqiA/YcfP family alpha/beta fold hydrolase [Arcobacteraceae]MBL3519280.1 esterase [Aliarcobacter lanthieri]RBQ26373.1 esterase [Arcobacter sp. CECT 9188]